MLIDNVMRHAILLFSLTAFLCAIFGGSSVPRTKNVVWAHGEVPRLLLKQDSPSQGVPPVAASHSCSWDSPCGDESDDNALGDDEGQEVEFISATWPHAVDSGPLGPEAWHQPEGTNSHGLLRPPIT